MRKSTDEKKGASAAILATWPHMAQARAMERPIAA
jgi:hypothetical protein